MLDTWGSTGATSKVRGLDASASIKPAPANTHDSNSVACNQNDYLKSQVVKFIRSLHSSQSDAYSDVVALKRK